MAILAHCDDQAMGCSQHVPAIETRACLGVIAGGSSQYATQGSLKKSGL